jgi:5-methylcytosine-specific restriction endonuclease McrA
MADRNPRVRNGHRRRQVRAQVLAEEDVCALCGQLVDKTLPAGLPGSPEIDEVVPISLGGNPYDRRGCRLTHRLCNQRRGNGLRRPRRVIRNFTTERTWTP